MNKLDVTGLSCPMPVMRVHEALKQGSLPLEVTVDDGAPLENITRLAENQGLKVKQTDLGNGSFRLELVK